MFRGLLRKIFRNKYVFLIISSLIFGSMHVIPILTNPMQLLYLISYILSGLQFGYIYIKTDNIFASTVLHIFDNVLALVLMLL